MGYCESTSLGREKTRFAEDANLVFNCDPYRYGDDKSETDVNGKSLINAGTAACSGILSFTLTEETSFGITLHGTTGYIGILSAPAGDYEINLKTRKLYKDGVLANIYFDAVNTIFERFIINPGTYQIDVSNSIVVNYDYTETFL
jgi:phage-related protein